MDAVLSVLKEFRLNGGYPQHVNKIIRTSRRFFEAIDRKEETTIAHLNRTNSMVTHIITITPYTQHIHDTHSHTCL